MKYICDCGTGLNPAQIGSQEDVLIFIELPWDSILIFVLHDTPRDKYTALPTSYRHRATCLPTYAT